MQAVGKGSDTLTPFDAEEKETGKLYSKGFCTCYNDVGCLHALPRQLCSTCGGPEVSNNADCPSIFRAECTGRDVNPHSCQGMHSISKSVLIQASAFRARRGKSSRCTGTDAHGCGARGAGWGYGCQHQGGHPVQLPCRWPAGSCASSSPLLVEATPLHPGTTSVRPQTRPHCVNHCSRRTGAVLLVK